MIDKPDVRRSIRLPDKKARSQKITLFGTISLDSIEEALKQVANEISGTYVKKLVLDYDGIKQFDLGIKSDYPAEDVVLLTGSSIDKANPYFIMAEKLYHPNELYVASTTWPGETYAIAFTNEAVVKAVENVRDRLEEKLKEKIIQK
ncbi:hypothetical protein KY348_06695 [Candidatus Woesearchaeota archaeon]|nr:hypothetical protein [Candidatus Woesearchaeota archaeon]